jgi:hypothetical protein
VPSPLYLKSIKTNTPGAREKLYECARTALINKFGGIEALASADLALARERLALALAIVQLEKDASSGQSRA